MRWPGLVARVALTAPLPRCVPPPDPQTSADQFAPPVADEAGERIGRLAPVGPRPSGAASLG
jgi:hypothetical protein